MRIIGYIDHAVLKITVFKMDTRMMVKFETGLYEQAYKFRMSTRLSGLENIRELIDEGFINSVLAVFSDMHKVKTLALDRFQEKDYSEGFDDII